MIKEKIKINYLFLFYENIYYLYLDNKNIIKSLIYISCIIICFLINKKINVCVCTAGKIENRYIIEFVEHYKKYCVNKIFLYDNNDINGEKFEDVINNYIKGGFVKLIIYFIINFFIRKKENKF